MMVRSGEWHNLFYTYIQHFIYAGLVLWLDRVDGWTPRQKFSYLKLYITRPTNGNGYIVFHKFYHFKKCFNTQLTNTQRYNNSSKY